MEKIKTDLPVPYTIIEIAPVTHDTKAFRFALPENASLDMMPGDHLHAHLEIDGNQISRPYTPVSTPDDIGFFELIIKRYPNGIMSRYLHTRGVGDTVKLSGPFIGGHYRPGMAKKIGMIAGGAGITPMITIIRTIIRNRHNVQLSLIYANKSENDIILREELEKYAVDFPNFRMLLALDQPPINWSGHSGFIDSELLALYLPLPDTESVIFLSGPPMMEFKIREALLKLGHDKKRIVIP
ncbi:MAG: cytochrome-b5 reductase [candidate division Zixibacteria bacterium]|nr:cytochrome-b5 reductase [candidate division Zixibacteria bacterium]